MAKVPYGINGPFIGRVGNTIGYILNGINVIRSIGAFHGEYTPKQLANYQRMGLISSLSTVIQEFLKFGFAAVAAPTKQGHTNHSISINKEKAVKGVYPNQETDFSKLIVAQGTVAIPKNPMVKVLNNKLEYRWEADLQTEGAESSDQVMLLAYFPESQKAIVMASGSRRTMEKEILEIPGSNKDRKVETYMAFVSDDRKNASNSVYLGQLIIPATAETAQKKPAEAVKTKDHRLKLTAETEDAIDLIPKPYKDKDGYSDLYHFGSKYTEQTEKMRIVSPLLSLFKDQINKGFEHGDRRTTPFNKAVSRNINGAIGGGDRVYNIYFPALVFSAGKRETAWATKLTLHSENEVRVKWEVPKTAKMSLIGDDEPHFIFYNRTRDIQCATYQTSKRRDLEASIELSGARKGDIIYAYMFFVAHDKKSVSNTDYLGCIEVE
ncbi:DUF6266 family protein [Pedobacter sp. MR2016-24]|uniref:DUF6266 family protein n=1 Tax=Pedobacter sp. MR2016-24 TaxID=2994466 RepID=UPI00224616DF|nr:DUF6266 family protein [Pedobacter sp. MR2016-24]MCX2485501.1 DUF6266 family protein [Pedobacter sp. MR2016-24]